MAEIIENKNKEIKNEKPIKAVFKYYIAKSLIEDYHMELAGINMNTDKSGKLVFFFFDSLDLRNNMQKIVKERRQRFAERKRDDEAEQPMQED